MPHDLRVLLSDVQIFIARLERFTDSRTLEELKQDELRSAAVQLEFVLIAEALKRIERTSPEVYRRVQRVREVANFRNVIVHDYDHIDLELTWDSVIKDVPVLKQQIDAWAAEIGMQTPPEAAQ